jgi:hypothetical protein
MLRSTGLLGSYLARASLSFVCALAFASCSASLAAPVTLRFEATVGPPRQGVDASVPPNWNMSLQQGDSISGTFTFEPFDAASNTPKTTLVQPFDFSFHIKNRTLTTSQYVVEVFNDHTSVDAPNPTDDINIGCSFLGGGTICAPATVSPVDPTEWAFGIALFGDSTVLDGADIPSSPLVWQSFSFYDMDVTFRETFSNRFYGFAATPVSFQLVPEPTSALQIVLAAVVFFLFARYTLRKFSKPEVT